uniref:Transmembrane protein n=1 Tax=Trypanosoma congolense (strain IL3000) TaxID=1068625 RepID=G0US04_TRYCI|nr:conserved hypothetical protein [Trypanosoma congolense IL3000]
MLRLRCNLCVPVAVSRRGSFMHSQTWTSVQRVNGSVCSSKRFFSGVPFFASVVHVQRRWIRAKSHDQGVGGNDKKSQEGSGDDDAGRGGDKAKAASGLYSHIRGLREDFRKFPDIYNSANAINFVLFTSFCLCSTGSNVETKWWMDNWGIDATFAPLAWVLHSFMINNFLSTALAMLLLHTMCHSVLPTIGSRGLIIYCLITATVSGFIMWLGNSIMNNTSEKQFGPWDMVAALFVMQYLCQGLTPIQILNSFNGWLRYACWVGALCILYYDWQPTAIGTLVGLSLCKGHPRFRVTSSAT